MKTTFTVSKSIALTLICAAMFSYGAATQGQKGGRAPRGSVSKAAGLMDQADKLADDRKYPEAIEAYKLAIQLDPNYAPPHGGLGDAYLNSGTWEQALAEYKEQVRLAPNDAQAQYDLGYLYNVMGRHGEAFAPLVKATALDPTFAEAFYEIGYAYLRGADFDKSIPFFRSAVKLKPDYGDAYYGLGQAYARLGKADFANEQLKKLSGLDPKLASKLAKEIPVAAEAAAADRIASETARQTVGSETQPAASSVAPARESVVAQAASAENAQIRNSSPAAPSASKPSMPSENASRESESVRERQEPSSASSPQSAPDSQSQINQVRAQPESSDFNRERAGTISSPNPQPISDGDWTEIIRQTMPGVVSIILFNTEGNPVGTGSGFLVGADGIVITNYHVIKGVNAARVITKQSEKFEVKGVVYIDPEKDFAVLKIPGFELPTVALGNSNNVEVGERVLAIGDPKGPTGSVSAGILTAQVRELPDYPGASWIQTTAPISPGNSGGPLLNRRGEVIGVMTLTRRDGQDVNFAVPINYVRGALQLGTAIKYSLPELAKDEADRERAAFEMAYAKYSDPGGIFNVRVLKEWRTQHARRTFENGITADETLFAPQSAALAEIDGYLSEGMRVAVYLPAPGGYFTPEAIEKFKNQVPELALRGNPGLEISNSGMFTINGLQAKVYTIDGKGQRLPEAERNVSYVFGNQKAIVQIDVVEPVSQVASLDQITQLAKTFEFNAGFAGRADGPLVSLPSGSGSQPTKEVTLKDLELSFSSNLFDDTIRNATRFLQTTPNSPQAHLYLGLSLLVKKDVDNAVLHLEQTVLLGDPITLSVKKLREPVLGHGLDDATVTFTKDSVIIRSGTSLFQAGFSALSESRMANYNNSCPIAFLKGQFLEGANNPAKPIEKAFNLFSNSASLGPLQQGSLIHNMAACNDEAIVTTAIVKLLDRLMVNKR